MPTDLLLVLHLWHHHLNQLCAHSANIESVVHESIDKSSDGLHDAACTACEMMVVWMQNRVRLNETEDQILNYVNEVNKN